MSQPTPYTPNADFSQQEANNASGRSTVNTAALDAEFAAIETTLDQTLANLQLIQRDDGQLKDTIVSVMALDQSVINLMGGWTLKGAWLTVTDYAVNDIVSSGEYTYVCLTAHHSGIEFDSQYWSRFGFAGSADAAIAASQASASATSAATSATTATSKATSATSSAASASTSAGNASAHASAAMTKAGEAAASATNAANSAAKLPNLTAAGANKVVISNDLGLAWEYKTYQELVDEVDISARGSEQIGFLPAGTGAVATDVQSKLRDSVSVRDFGGDPINISPQNDLAFAAAALNGIDNVLLPKGTYEITSSPALSVTGPGILNVGAITIGGHDLLQPVDRSVINLTPESYTTKVVGETASPASGTPYFNVGIGHDVDMSGNVWRSTVVGSLALTRPVEIERCEVFGNGAMRFARRAQRCTAIGTLALQWLGADNQQYLRDTYHDFWIDGAPFPGTAGWDFMGLETRNPGIGTKINAFAAYPTATSECATVVAIGRDAALHAAKDFGSVYIGYQAGTNVFSSSENVAVGEKALRDSVFVSRSTAVGRNAGFLLQEGSGNVYIGNVSGSDHVTGNNNIFIGEASGAGLGSNQTDLLVVQNRSTALPMLLGNAATTKLGIGVTTLEMLNELPTRGLMISAPDGDTSGPTLRFRFGDTTMSAGQQYGALEWFGSDNQGAGVRAKIVAMGTSTLGEAGLHFFTQPISANGDSPVLRFQINGYGSVRMVPMGTPSTAVAGDMYYDSTTNKARCYNGTSWFDLF